MIFQPTRPLRGATRKSTAFPQRRLNFNPRAPCGARPVGTGGNVFDKLISTHAPLAGRDIGDKLSIFKVIRFQPTRPLRGATNQPEYKSENQEISTHAPLAGRDYMSGNLADALSISTHAPLAGRDRRRWYTIPKSVKFQPTRPLRGATRLCLSLINALVNFNPRAPCGARQFMARFTFPVLLNFNPRAPCGARLCYPRYRGHRSPFQPTRPLRGATPSRFNIIRRFWISTHAPLAGRDSERVALACATEIFQPTRPLRGATAKVYKSLCTFLR